MLLTDMCMLRKNYCGLNPFRSGFTSTDHNGISWKENDGFFYSSYDKPKGSELSAKTDQHKLYYHKLGTSQAEDELIYGGVPEEKHRYVGGYVTEDNRYLVVTASVSTSGNKLFIKDLTEAGSGFVTVFWIVWRPSKTILIIT